MEETQKQFDIQNIIRTDKTGQIKAVITDFVETLAKHPNEPAETWLVPKMKSYMPNKSDDEIAAMVKDIAETIQTAEASQKSLNKAIAEGKSAKGWLAGQIKDNVKNLSDEEKTEYLNNIKTAAAEVNQTVCDAAVQTIIGEGAANE